MPKEQLQIKKHTQCRGLLTTTYNCDVKVFLKDNNGATYSQKVTSIKMVDDLTHRALKRTLKAVTTKRNQPDSIPENPQNQRLELNESPDQTTFLTMDNS